MNERGLIEIAMQHPELFVAHIVYLDSKANVTERSVSPLCYLSAGVVRVYCLGRSSVRSLKFSGMLRVRLRLAHDVLSPEQVTDLVNHRRRLRTLDKPIETGLQTHG